jgi:serine protease Do
MTRMKRSFGSLLGIAAAAVLLLAACGARPSGGTENQGGAGSSEQPAAAQTASGGQENAAAAADQGPVKQQAGPLPQPSQSLVALQTSFQQVAEAVQPVVVQIDVVQVVQQQQAPITNPFEFFFGPHRNQPQQFRRPGLGSGVLVHQDGDTVYVLTNNHVVGEADEISVILHDQSTHKAKLVGNDPRMDLALVSFSSKQKLQMAALGNSDAVKTGDWVLAVGNPLGLTSTVTAGIISAVGRTEGPAGSISDFLQTDAAINPGNSGGALVNIEGQVIGINTWIASTTGSYIGAGFAVPVNNARRVINELLTKGKVEYGWLGVSIRDPLPATRSDLKLGETTGSLVFNLYKGSPADKAGLVPGDYITDINGAGVQDTQDLTRRVGRLSPGEKARFQLVHFGKQEEVTVEVTERLSESQLSQEVQNLWPGMVVISAKDAPQFPVDRGVAVVAMAYQGTPAGSAGFQQGDVILEIGGKRIDNMMDFYRQLDAGGSGRLAFRVLRQGREIQLGLSR